MSGLYYPYKVLISIIIFIVGLVILETGAEAMVRGSVGIARRLGLSQIVIGLTIVAFGTSAPELLVSVIAAIKKSSDLSIGNVVGSNIANIGLIVGLTAIVLPIRFDRSLLRMDIPVLFISMVALFFFSIDGSISRWDAVALFCGLILFIITTYRSVSKRGNNNTEGKEDIGIPSSLFIGIIAVIVGIAGLVGGAHLMVKSAVSIARTLGISELVIGATVVAIGTSLPELATSMVAVIKRQPDIGLGNVIGSNIFNVCCILGIAPLIRPLGVNPSLPHREYPIMIIFSILLALMLTKSRNYISRWEGAFLFISFVGFLVWCFYHGGAAV